MADFRLDEAHRCLFTYFQNKSCADCTNRNELSAKSQNYSSGKGTTSTNTFQCRLSPAHHSIDINPLNSSLLFHTGEEFKMPPKGASTKLQPMRLPPLPNLRVRRPNQADANPCLAIMSSVLSTSPIPSSSSL